MNFPILVLGVNDGIDYSATNDALSIATSTTLKSGILLQNFIVDCNGNRFRPKSIAKEKMLKFNIFLDHLWRVKYEFIIPPSHISLEELKNEASSRVMQDVALFEEIGDFKLLLNQLKGAISFYELISLFGPEVTDWKR